MPSLGMYGFSVCERPVFDQSIAMWYWTEMQIFVIGSLNKVYF